MYAGPFILDFGGARFYCSYASKKAMKCNKKWLEEKYPDTEFIVRPYMVNMIEVNEETGEVLNWEKIKGWWSYYSIWYKPTNADIE